MSAKPRILTFDVALDRDWTARSALGGSPFSQEAEWTAEHLVLTALCRCILTSFRYHCRRANHEPSSNASAHGAVTRRESDGRFAFVAIRADLDVTLEPLPGAEVVRELIAKGERDCFVGASLNVEPDYHWTVNGEDLS